MPTNVTPEYKKTEEAYRAAHQVAPGRTWDLRNLAAMAAQRYAYDEALGYLEE